VRVLAEEAALYKPLVKQQGDFDHFRAMERDRDAPNFFKFFSLFVLISDQSRGKRVGRTLTFVRSRYKVTLLWGAEEHCRKRGNTDMNTKFIYLAGASFCLATAASAEGFYGGVGLEYSTSSYASSSGDIEGGEPRHHNTGHLNGHFGYKFSSGFFADLDLAYSDTDIGTTTNGEDTNDGTDSYTQALVSLGYQVEDTAFIGFLGRGDLQMVAVDGDEDQDATTTSFGVGLGHEFGNLALGLSLGGMSVVSQEDGEALDDFVFGNISLDYQLSNSNFSFGGDVFLASGTQDFDESTSESVELTGAGIEVRYTPSGASSLGRIQYYAGFQMVELIEASDPDDDIYHDRWYLGLEIAFGPQARSRSASAAMPVNLMWIQQASITLD